MPPRTRGRVSLSLCLSACMRMHQGFPLKMAETGSWKEDRWKRRGSKTRSEELKGGAASAEWDEGLTVDLVDGGADGGPRRVGNHPLDVVEGRALGCGRGRQRGWRWRGRRGRGASAPSEDTRKRKEETGKRRWKRHEQRGRRGRKKGARYG